MPKEKGKAEKIKAELAQCKKERGEYLEGWQRAKAELVNSSREEQERMEGFLKFATQGIALNLLPILDSFDLAEKALSCEQKRQGEAEGLLRIKRALTDVLEKEGLCEIELIGKKFEPEFAEAVGEIKKKGVEPGIIVEIARKGYELRGKVLRPAGVIVSS